MNIRNWINRMIHGYKIGREQKYCKKGIHRNYNKVKMTYNYKGKDKGIQFDECKYCQSKRFFSKADEKFYLKMEKLFRDEILGC